MNNIYRKDLINKIDKAIADASTIPSELEHPYLNGKYKEILVGQLLEPLLSSDYSVGSGKVVDSHGKISHEIDVLLYSKRILPPQLYSDTFGVFPVESVLSCIEVKSTLTVDELRGTYNKYKDLKSKIRCSSGNYSENDEPIEHPVLDATRDLFAFSSPNNIFENYKKIDQYWSSEPTINSICVSNCGYWGFSGHKWLFTEVTTDHDEIINFLTSLCATLFKVSRSRGIPRIGQYLTKSVPTTLA